MVAYSFKSQFVEAIQTGLKRQTIRKDRYGRSRHAAPGGAVTLLTGARFSPTLLGRTTCTAIWNVRLDFRVNRGRVLLHNPVTGERADLHQGVALHDFARQDGFQDWESMREFWDAVHSADTFEGTMIQWGFPFDV